MYNLGIFFIILAVLLLVVQLAIAIWLEYHCTKTYFVYAVISGFIGTILISL